MGAFNTLLTVALFSVLGNLIEISSAAFLAYATASLLAFLAGRRVVFPEADRTRWSLQLARYATVQCLLSLLNALLVVSLLSSVLDLSLAHAQAIASIPLAVGSFVLQRFWVFRQQRAARG